MSLKIPKGWRRVKAGNARPKVYQYFWLGAWYKGCDSGYIILSTDCPVITPIRRAQPRRHAGKGKAK